jgi:hypothetical protein
MVGPHKKFVNNKINKNFECVNINNKISNKQLIILDTY